MARIRESLHAIIVLIITMLVESNPTSIIATEIQRRSGHFDQLKRCRNHHRSHLYSIILRGGSPDADQNAKCSDSSEESDSLNCFMKQAQVEKTFPEVEDMTVNSTEQNWKDIPGPHSFSEESEEADVVSPALVSH